jgi:GGDEF domain-containing protein
MHNNIFHVFRISDHHGSPQHRLLGRVYLDDNGKFEVLDDHGLPPALHDPTSEGAAAAMEMLMNSMNYQVVNAEHLSSGHYPDFMDEQSLPDKPNGDSEPVPAKEIHYHYHRIGMPAPARLVVSRDGHVTLDGHDLSTDEIDTIQDNIRAGNASLDEVPPAPLSSLMIKSETEAKWSPHPTLGFDHELPDFGNIRSHKDWLNTLPTGGHVMVDAHATRAIAEHYGELTCRKYLAAFGRELGKVAKKVHAQALFRLGGDRFLVHVPTPEHGLSFARQFRANLDELPAVGGTHTFSATVGVGTNHLEATKAHRQAKDTKAAGNHRPGQAPFHVAINAPGY